MSDRIIVGPDGRKYITNEPLMSNPRDCEHGRQRGKCADCDVARLEALNAELVEALQSVVQVWFRKDGINYVDFRPYMDAARAALANSKINSEGKAK